MKKLILLSIVLFTLEVNAQIGKSPYDINTIYVTGGYSAYTYRAETIDKVGRTTFRNDNIYNSWCMYAFYFKYGQCVTYTVFTPSRDVDSYLKNLCDIKYTKDDYNMRWTYTDNYTICICERVVSNFEGLPMYEYNTYKLNDYLVYGSRNAIWAK